MLVHKNSATISVFPLMILVGISVLRGTLVLQNLRISFLIPPMYTSANARVIFILQYGFENWIINVFSN